VASARGSMEHDLDTAFQNSDKEPVDRLRNGTFPGQRSCYNPTYSPFAFPICIHPFIKRAYILPMRKLTSVAEGDELFDPWFTSSDVWGLTAQ